MAGFVALFPQLDQRLDPQKDSDVFPLLVSTASSWTWLLFTQAV